MTERVRIVSWNVNGIRSAVTKGFLRWLSRDAADIVGIQESRASPDQLDGPILNPRHYSVHWVFGVKKGYSGVATFSRAAPRSVDTSLDDPQFDCEGRMLGTEHPNFWLYNVYFPKGSGTTRDNSRVPYKLAFYQALFDHVLEKQERSGKPVIVMGDFNTAHREMDLFHAKQNVKNSGFLPEERADLEKHLRRGFVDTFRHLHPDTVQYTWWSQQPGVREKNIGWRIDGVWISKDLLPHLKEAFILDRVKGSDHCPVGVVLEW